MNDVTDLLAQAPRGWFTLGLIVAALAAKSLIRALLPEGWHFRFVEKWLVDEDDEKEKDESV